MVSSVALLVVGGLYRFAPSHPEQQPVEIAYLTDRATPITLSDGTKVWLSAHSQLRYRQTFDGKTRDVALEGEAYFEVAHNSRQPFRVLAGDQTVVALGTSFNVRAYTGEADVTVTLVEGSVRVTDDRSGQAVILKPAQEATIAKNTGMVTVADGKSQQTEDVKPEPEIETVHSPVAIAVGDADIDRLMSWKTGRYVFNNMTFEDIAKMLEKGFKVTIHVENEELKNKPYTMRFENGESLERILDLIQISAKYSYWYNNGTIIIK
jgi:ferric-dicitrate binding protein FerR (iron transport regulator)